MRQVRKSLEQDWPKCRPKWPSLMEQLMKTTQGSVTALIRIPVSIWRCSTKRRTVSNNREMLCLYSFTFIQILTCWAARSALASIKRGNGCNGKEGISMPRDPLSAADMEDVGAVVPASDVIKLVDFTLDVPWWWWWNEDVKLVVAPDCWVDTLLALLLQRLFPLIDSRGWWMPNEFSAITCCKRVWWTPEAPIARSPNARWLPTDRPIGSNERMDVSCLPCPWLSCLRHFARRFWNQTCSMDV